MLYWYFSLVGKTSRHSTVLVIERLLAPRLIIERVICRYIYGKTHRAYFPWDQILYLPCSPTVQLIL